MDLALLRGTVKSQLAWGNFDEFDFINLSLKKLVKIQQRQLEIRIRGLEETNLLGCDL